MARRPHKNTAVLAASLTVAGVTTMACTPSNEQTPDAPVPEEAAVEPTSMNPFDPDFDISGDHLRFTAQLTIDPRPGGKKEQPVWLQREDGDRARYVIAYQPHALWRPFDGMRVEVVGEICEPAGQAMGATHLRVLSLQPVDDAAQTDPFRIGPELEVTGRFVEEAGEPGSKSEGSRWLVLMTTDGAGYLLEGQRPTPEQVGPQVIVRGRAVEPSPFKTRMGGRYIWILEIRPAP